MDHHQIIFAHLDSGRSALHIRFVTGTLMMPDVVPFYESVSIPRYFLPNLLAVCDEVVWASMLKDVAAIPIQGSLHRSVIVYLGQTST